MHQPPKEGLFPDIRHLTSDFSGWLFEIFPEQKVPGFLFFLTPASAANKIFPADVRSDIT